MPNKALVEIIHELESYPVALNPAKILDAAQSATGLKELGQSDFYLRLDSYISAIDHPNLTEFGRLIGLIQCYQFACSRLRLQKLVSSHPEIYSEKIDRPIVIVGPGRSGTTYLQRVMANDSRFNYVTRRDSVSVFPEPDGKGFDPPLFELLKRCIDDATRRDVTNTINANWPKTTGNDPIEDIALLGPDLPVGLLEFRLPFPSGNYLEDENTRHYEYMKVMLQALQWLHGGKRWVLKDPIHSLALPALMSVFPDAIIVATHRDPLASIKSYVNKFAPLSQMIYRETRLDELARYCVYRTKLMRAAIYRDHDIVPEGQLVDVLFHEFVSDNASTVRRIYEQAGLAFSAENKRRIDGFTPTVRDYNQNTHKYNIGEDCCLNLKDVRREFAFYYENYPVEFEVV